MTNSNTSNAVEVFNNEEFGSVRTTMINGEPWFVAVDVCKALEISNPTMALDRLDPDEKMTLSLTEGHSGQRGGAQQVNIVNEPGLYVLVIGSRKPEAKTFRRWITHDVIPTIRKTGSYLTGEDAAALKIIRAGDTLERSVAIAEYRDVVTAPYKQQIEEQKPKVEFADHVSASENSVDMGEFAKIVQKNGIKLGRNNPFSKLRELKILMDGNLPYQQYMNAGWFEVVESTYERSGTLYVSPKTLVTGKGQIALVRKLRKALAEESTRYIA